MPLHDGASDDNTDTHESTPLSCTNSDFNNDGRVDRVCTFASSAGQVFQLTDAVARVHFT